MKQPPQATTLLDRLAVAWISGITAAITGGIIFLAFQNIQFFAECIDVYVIFICVMAALGFLFLEDYSLNLLNWILRLLVPADYYK